jgi:hypothetical protein
MVQVKPPGSMQAGGAPDVQACVASGLLLLLQRPRAVSPEDCPGEFVWRWLDVLAGCANSA